MASLSSLPYIPPDVIVFSMIASNAIGGEDVYAFRKVCTAWGAALDDATMLDSLVSRGDIPQAVAKNLLGSCIRIPVLLKFLEDLPKVYRRTPKMAYSHMLRPIEDAIVFDRPPETKDELVKTLDALTDLDVYVRATYPLWGAPHLRTNLSRWVRFGIMRFLEKALEPSVIERILCEDCQALMYDHVCKMCHLYARSFVEDAPRDDSNARHAFRFRDKIYAVWDIGVKRRKWDT